MAKAPAGRFPSAAAMADAATAVASAAVTADVVTRPAPEGAAADRTLVVPAPGPPSGPRRDRRRAAIWALLLAALAVVGVALWAVGPALLDPGRSDPPVSPQEQPVGSPDAGQNGEAGDGSGAPGQPGVTPSARGENAGSSGRPAAPSEGGDDPADPAPSAPGGTEPTPPAEEPTGPAPSEPAEEEPAATAGGQAPATAAP
jgi:serine/threonine-protein kinase